MTRQMVRGAVYLTEIELPHSAVAGNPDSKVLDKYMVVLQGGAPFEAQQNVAVVLASTRKGMKPARPFEVYLSNLDGFDHDTVIDGRWVYTFLKTDLPEVTRKFVLSVAVMEDVSLAVTAGLQL